MKKIPVFIALLFFINAALAQTGTVKGLVKDSLTGVVLESATVSLFARDSSLINYQLTNGSGEFSIGKLPLQTDIFLNVTYVGFQNHDEKIRLDSSGYKATILLKPSFNDSNNVTVTAHIPIKMNGDTLEINPAAFKMDPNAVVEDLLTQVPGLTVWADGTITMNGRKIPSVLVDGKPFMGSDDARLATQNLPKDAVDKIQVYQEVDRSVNSLDRKPKDSLLTMNIKLKENKKKGYFGKIGAGYGTDKRYESNLSFQMYDKKTSFGIGGGLNNINRNIDNLKEMFQSNTYRNYNPNLENVGNFNKEGINKYHSIGGVLTHNFIETTNSRQNDRITLNYTKAGNDKYLTRQSLQNRTALDNPQFIEDNAVSNEHSSSHNVGINYIKTNSYDDNFDINGTLGWNVNNSGQSKETFVRDSTNSLQSYNTENSREDRKASNQSLSMNYTKSSNENPLAAFSVDVNAYTSQNQSDRFVDSRFTSYIDSNKDTAYNRHYNTNNDNTSLRTSLNYRGIKRLLFGRFNLWGIDLTLTQWLNYSKAKTAANVFDYDSLASKYTSNKLLTHNNRNEKIEYSPLMQFSKLFWKGGEKYSKYFNLSANIIQDFKTDNNTSSFANRNLSRTFSFFRYTGDIGFQYYRHNLIRSYVSINYDRTFDYPGIDQLYTITDEQNVYNIRYGNPFLKNTVNNNYSFYGNFNTEKQNSKYAFGMNMNGSYSQSLNPVTDSLINDPSGKRYYYYVNAGQSNSYNLSYRLNVTRRIKKSNIQLTYNGSFNNGARPGYIDNVFSETKTYGINNNLSLQFSLRSAVIFSIGKTYNNYRSEQSGPGLSSFTNYNDISRLGFTVNYPQNLSFSTSLNYTKNSNVHDPITLWNAFATYRFLKSQQGELKFSAMDILRQFRNISNSADQFGTTTRITNGLQQFFLLTFSYYPRKFGKAEIKKREIKNEW